MKPYMIGADPPEDDIERWRHIRDEFDRLRHSYLLSGMERAADLCGKYATEYDRKIRARVHRETK